MMQGQGSVGFSETVPAACDIFFTSGTLQYLEDPFSILNQGFASAGFAAILARNSFSDIELFRVQRSKLFDNGSGDIPDGYKNVSLSYPHRTIKELPLEKLPKGTDYNVSHGSKIVAGSSPTGEWSTANSWFFSGGTASRRRTGMNRLFALISTGWQKGKPSRRMVTGHLLGVVGNTEPFKSETQSSALGTISKRQCDCRVTIFRNGYSTSLCAPGFRLLSFSPCCKQRIRGAFSVLG